MKQLIFMLAVTLLFTTVSYEAHAYFIKMMSMRVGFMWLLHIMQTMEAETMFDICSMLFHLPFAISFTVLQCNVDVDYPLQMLSGLFMVLDWAHVLMDFCFLAHEYWQKEGPLNW